MIADYIDQFIMFCAGLWMSGVGFGLLAFPIRPIPGSRGGWNISSDISSGWARCLW